MKKRFNIIKSFFSSILALAFYFLLSSCNPSRHLQEGEYLLDKNIVIDKYPQVDKSDIESYIKQRPNRKMIFFKTYLWIYNSVSQEKLDRIKQKRIAKIEAYNSRQIEKYKLINAKREANGKAPKKVKQKSKDIRPLREWWRSNGEPPVIYDSLLTEKSVKQIKQFLTNKGFFNNVVRDSADNRKKKFIYKFIPTSDTSNYKRTKKERVYYHIHEGRPYSIRTIFYQIHDDLLSYYVLSEVSGSLIQQGNNYDADDLQKERDRLTKVLRNEGYYTFSKEYIYYEVDTSLGTRQVDITIGIKNPTIKTTLENGNDTTKETTHSRYYINHIYIYTDYDPKTKTRSRDTLLLDDYYLLSNGALRYRPRLLLDAMFISKGELFQQTHVDQTYARLSDLRMFRSIQMSFNPVSSDKLDCFIYLSNIPKQSLSIETEGINTSGTQGIAGNVVYQNKNVFKGGEIFEWKIKGSIEAQKSKVRNKNIIIKGLDSTKIFNTLEVGTEMRLTVPRFQTPFHISGAKSNNAKTSYIGSYTYQQRPDYGRLMGNLSYGYSWKETPEKQHTINPIEFSFVNIFREDSAVRYMKSKDIFFKNSYSNHFTLATHYVFLFNNQDIKKKKNFSYFRFSLEGAGNTMRGIFSVIDKQLRKHHDFLAYYPDTILKEDNKIDTILPSYTVKDIRFSQYVRSDIDYRHYFSIGSNTKDMLVYRVAFGIGKPFANLRALPLEKSFYVGGPNSIRAWQSRTLGPGAYFDPLGNNVADKIGDVKFESNLEYRFNIIKMVNAAMFVDAGNIWLRKPYPNYANGEITNSGGNIIPIDNLISQIAIGAGLGIRLDFNFFIIRFDGAIKIKDPSLIEDVKMHQYPWVFTKIGNKQWASNYRNEHSFSYPFAVLNFGIGYPF